MLAWSIPIKITSNNKWKQITYEMIKNMRLFWLIYNSSQYTFWYSQLKNYQRLSNFNDHFDSFIFEIYKYFKFYIKY